MIILKPMTYSLACALIGLKCLLICVCITAQSAHAEETSWQAPPRAEDRRAYYAGHLEFNIPSNAILSSSHWLNFPIDKENDITLEEYSFSQPGHGDEEFQSAIDKRRQIVSENHNAIWVTTESLEHQLGRPSYLIAWARNVFNDQGSLEHYPGGAKTRPTLPLFSSLELWVQLEAGYLVFSNFNWYGSRNPELDMERIKSIIDDQKQALSAWVFKFLPRYGGLESRDTSRSGFRTNLGYIECAPDDICPIYKLFFELKRSNIIATIDIEMHSNFVDYEKAAKSMTRNVLRHFFEPGQAMPLIRPRQVGEMRGLETLDTLSACNNSQLLWLGLPNGDKADLPMLAIKMSGIFTTSGSHDGCSRIWPIWNEILNGVKVHP